MPPKITDKGTMLAASNGIGRRLYQQRLAKGWTQEQAATVPSGMTREQAVPEWPTATIAKLINSIPVSTTSVVRTTTGGLGHARII